MTRPTRASKGRQKALERAFLARCERFVADWSKATSGARSTTVTRRRPTTVDFVVRYPWGSEFVLGLRRALRRLGVPTMHDGFNDGSDVESFFMAVDRRRLTAGRRLIQAYDGFLKAHGEGLPLFDETLAALDLGGVYEVMQDWKHLHWEFDVMNLAEVGLSLRLLSSRMHEGSEELTFRVSRAENRSKRRRRRRRSALKTF